MAYWGYKKTNHWYVLLWRVFEIGRVCNLQPLVFFMNVSTPPSLKDDRFNIVFFRQETFPNCLVFLSSRADWGQAPLKIPFFNLPAFSCQTKQAEDLLSHLKEETLKTFLAIRKSRQFVVHLILWWWKRWYNHFLIWLVSSLVWLFTKKSLPNSLQPTSPKIFPLTSKLWGFPPKNHHVAYATEDSSI